jgi:GR25 family glycosyltransferase involved in LPS biosynthesis
MSENIAKTFLESYQINDAINLLRYLRNNNFYHISKQICKFLYPKFFFSLDILDEYAISAYYTGDIQLSYDINTQILNFKGLDEETSKRIIYNNHFSIDLIANRYNYYNQGIVNNISNRYEKDLPLITFSITTCKRLNLFTSTINSFLNCCKDLYMIDEWICIDDNSSEEDRIKMKELYPFFNFYFKTKNEKGHPQSMNLIKKMVKTPYLFHIEDDWKFIEKKDYLTECLSVLAHNFKIGQCLINKNYVEKPDEIRLSKGGEFKVSHKGVRYYIHEYVTTDEQRINWHKKHGYGTHCNYWPHFSFRPSLLRTKILHELGDFNENISHFEREYSIRYINKGYVSAFLENIYCLHTGRLTSEINNKQKPNAYDLNNELQFDGKEQNIIYYNFNKIKSFVINLDRRPDRWSSFQNNAKQLSFLKYERFNAIDGNKLVSTRKLQRIFDGNDYNMRRGIVGVALSHIKLYIELLYSQNDVFFIMEDDLEFTPEFEKKFFHLYDQTKNINWDIIYLGHHLKNKITDAYDKDKMPVIERWNRYTSLNNSLGGVGGYLISKNGAKNLLEFINNHGMSNAIDTMQQKAADNLNVFYAFPHLFYSECHRQDKSVDSDIQYNFNSLTIPLEDRIKEDVIKYNLTEITNIDTMLCMITDNNIQNNFYYKNTDLNHIENIKKICIHRYYTLGNTTIIIISDKNTIIQTDILKYNDIYNIDDVIMYST